MSDVQDAASISSTNPSASPQGPAHRTVRSDKKKGRTLTDAQLARKRANDRDAQRAIRERTRTEIDALKARIAELESSDAQKKLQKALDERDAAVAENKNIKRRLAVAIGTLGPIIPPGDLHRLAETASTVKVEDENRPTLLSDRSATLSSTLYAMPLNHTDQLSYSSPRTPEPLQWDPVNSAAVPEDGRIQQESTSTTPYAQQEADYMGDSVATSPGSTLSIFMGLQPYDPHAFEQLPLNVPPTHLYDGVFAGFARDIRQKEKDGIAIDTLLGPPYVNYAALLVAKPEEPAPETHPMSSLVIAITQAFPTIRGWATRICIMINMFHYLRWFLHPTQDNFLAMPEYMRPLQAQLEIPHPIWFDFVPWPGIRNRLCNSSPQITLDDFVEPFAYAVGFDYPSGQRLEDCLYHDQANDEMRINPELRDRWRELNNWTLSQEFSRLYPHLARYARIRDD